MPEVPYFSLPGFTFAYATRSAMFLIGRSGLTAMMNGICTMRAMNVKSSGTLYGMLGLTAGRMVMPSEAAQTRL
jgi:hypothetical protein